MTDRQTGLPPIHESDLPHEHALYRPRHGRRQRMALICAVIFLLLPAAAFVFGVRPTDFENRRLAGFPSLSAGWAFFTSLSPWATDQLPLRQQGVEAAGGISRGVFGEPPAYGNGRQDSAIPLPAAAPPPAPSEFPQVLPGKDGWLYLGAEIANACEQSQPIGRIVDELRNLRDGIVASGRAFVVVIAPDKATMVPQYLPDNFVGRSCHATASARFWQAMSSQSYVVDLRGALNRWGQQLGAPVYGPQDAHWSDEGGVLMARGMMDKLQPGSTRNWSIRLGATYQVPADLPPLISESGVTVGHHYLILPDGRHNQTHPVNSDFTTPVHYDTASGPGTYAPSTMLLSDSFTIRAAPYLASVFDHLTVVQSTAVDPDHGVAVSRMLANNSAVVIEVAQRTLVTGKFDLLFPAVEQTVISELARHPIR